MFMKEKSLVLIKPDGVQRALVGEIIARFERCGLKIIGMKVVRANQEIAGEHYANDEKWLLSVGEKALEAAKKRGDKLNETAMEIGQRVRNQLMEYIAMSPVIAICLEGHNAVAKIRKLVGATNPQDAEMGTIRGDFSIDSFKMADMSGRPIQNLIHASGAVDEAEREIKIWFKEDELFEWERVDDALIYRMV